MVAAAAAVAAVVVAVVVCVRGGEHRDGDGGCDLTNKDGFRSGWEVSFFAFIFWVLGDCVLVRQNRCPSICLFLGLVWFGAPSSARS